MNRLRFVKENGKQFNIRIVEKRLTDIVPAKFIPVILGLNRLFYLPNVQLCTGHIS